MLEQAQKLSRRHRHVWNLVDSGTQEGIRRTLGKSHQRQKPGKRPHREHNSSAKTVSPKRVSFTNPSVLEKPNCSVVPVGVESWFIEPEQHVGAS